MKTCFIGMGSNEASPTLLLAAQKDLLAMFPDAVFSRLMQTVPVGFRSPRLFYNQVARCSTSLSSEEIRERLKQIELAHGRQPGDKTRGIVKIDLDLLSYDSIILKPEDWQRADVKKGITELTDCHPSFPPTCSE